MLLEDAIRNEPVFLVDERLLYKSPLELRYEEKLALTR